MGWLAPSSMAEYSIMDVCRVGTLYSGTFVGWGTGWGRGKVWWMKVAILLYSFFIFEPYLSEGTVFPFFIDRMASMSKAVWQN